MGLCRLLAQNKILRLPIRNYRTLSPIFGFNPSQDLESGTRWPSNGIQQTRSADDLKVSYYVDAFRLQGHRIANVNPLENKQDSLPAGSIFDADAHNLTSESLVGTVNSPSLSQCRNVEDLTSKLSDFYCGDITVETLHMMNSAEQTEFLHDYERIVSQPVSNEDQIETARLLLLSQSLDLFLAKRFTTTKRYSGEGAEACLPFYNFLFNEAAHQGLDSIVMCMAHRGRTNLLATLLQLSPATIFQKIKGMREWPEGVQGSGDTLSHLASSTTIKYGDDSIYVTMLPNPSHLEAVNPVAVGKARAKQRRSNDGAYDSSREGDSRYPGDKVMCLQVHGDAAFAGQGVVPETLAMAEVPHFNVGGSVHLIVNNQIGFTTEAVRGRSSEYASCIGKMNSIPIIRVNGDSPDAVVKAARVAMMYRNKFHRDVIVDLICYRRWGHNELDDPSFTQPHMYSKIDTRPTLPDSYSRQLVDEGLCSSEYFTEEVKKYRELLQKEYEAIDTHIPKACHLEDAWAGFMQAPSNITSWDTGVNKELLQYITSKSVETPEDFEVHTTLLKSHIPRRKEKAETGKSLDWAAAEACAFGSLLSQGFDVRLSGEDVGRGTFSHRHAMLVDQTTDGIHIPLNHLTESQGQLEVANSILSEEAGLGFEYGFSIESPRCLTIWEAQFGDFFNGAQILIDTFVSSGEAKWLLQSGLVMLLPNGMDGAGPEHTSARLERFLQLTDSSETHADGDNVNIIVAYPTTPAQYFHLLRRQMVRPYRKPLIVASPKGLLRHPACVSRLEDMSPGTAFSPVLTDSRPSASSLIFCSGKHYYTLAEEREKRDLTGRVALIRIEELCPFPLSHIQSILKSHPRASRFIWSQEEHRNNGAWSFVQPRFNLAGIQLQYAGRDVLAAPATGIGNVHKQECQEILDQTFALVAKQ